MDRNELSNFGKRSPKGLFCEIIRKPVQQFWRKSCLKQKLATDGRRTEAYHNSSTWALCAQVSWNFYPACLALSSTRVFTWGSVARALTQAFLKFDLTVWMCGLTNVFAGRNCHKIYYIVSSYGLILALFARVKISFAFSLEMPFRFIPSPQHVVVLIKFALTRRIYSQWAHDVYTTSFQRRCNVMTLHRRWGDVV